MTPASPHNFHIPVMGLAFTIDSPVKVARFGINSVLSIVEDHLIEMMRSHYYPTINEVYVPITIHEEDYRAKRIKDYLNLVNRIVKTQVDEVRKASFETGSDLDKYFRMLPGSHPARHRYFEMVSESDPVTKTSLQDWLRTQVVPGSIDVNIMTKTDRDNYSKSGELIEDGSDAVAALRGYANSELTNSSVIFSAGMNPRVYNYLERCSQFYPDECGALQKKVIVKVSDYRSALIQGKYLAKKGIWVSEYRVESGLNCGGHAFPTEGYLLGPIMEEFKEKREELSMAVFTLYKEALKQKQFAEPVEAPEVKISVQGGIGTAEEDQFLHTQYNISSTGWGTPFLLVPEATTVDNATLDLLSKAKKQDVILSSSSPLGVRFHYLKGTSAERERIERIEKGRPGSPCMEKHLAFNTEFTKEPICTASHRYQKLKIAQLQSLDLPEPTYQQKVSEVVSKECLCVGLSNSASINYDKPFLKRLTAVTICPGPNIANFSSVVSLETMIDHIYGRGDIMSNRDRSHMFIAELNLYTTYLQEEIRKDTDLTGKKKKYFEKFAENLLSGITYYRNLGKVTTKNPHSFYYSLNEAEKAIEQMVVSLNSERVEAHQEDSFSALKKV